METTHTHGLVPFNATTAVGAVNVTRAIREAMSRALETDPNLFPVVSSYVAPQGCAGSVQFDHAMAGETILNNVPELAKYSLNQVQAWKHLQEVLKQHGYRFSGGYIVGHVSEGAANDIDVEEPLMQERPAA